MSEEDVTPGSGVRSPLSGEVLLRQEWKMINHRVKGLLQSRTDDGLLQLTLNSRAMMRVIEDWVEV